MRLRVSGEHEGQDVNVAAISNKTDGGASSNVPHGELLIEFVEAVLSRDEEHRDALAERLELPVLFLVRTPNGFEERYTEYMAQFLGHSGH